MKAELTMQTKEVQSLRLARAILIYESHTGFNQSLRVHATVHQVEQPEKGPPILLPGVTASKPAIASLLAALGESVALSGFIPSQLLFAGPGMLIWWAAPAPRQVWFQDGSGKIGTRTGITPHPGLVFAVAGGHWYVWAVTGSDRPGQDARLYQAPYFNVWQNGEICTGNVALPESLGIETIQGYEAAFFGSYFTHPNIHARNKLLKHRGGAYGLWKELLDGKHEQFPERALVPAATPETLADLPAYLTKSHHR